MSTQFKNGYDVKKCLRKEKLVKLTVPELAKNHKALDKRMGEYCLGELMKTEIVIE